MNQVSPWHVKDTCSSGVEVLSARVFIRGSFDLDEIRGNGCGWGVGWRTSICGGMVSLERCSEG
jgi:hypothetical protein